MHPSSAPIAHAPLLSKGEKQKTIKKDTLSQAQTVPSIGRFCAKPRPIDHSPPSRFLYATPSTPGPLPPPPRPALTLTFCARAVKGGLPDITSARRHLLQLFQLCPSRSAQLPSPRLEAKGRRGGRGGEKRQARCPPRETHCRLLPAGRDHQHKMATMRKEPALRPPSTY